MTKATIRVLVVDDHPIVRRGISAEINLDPELSVIGEAQNGLEAVEMARQLKPDVILMDLVMPGMDGFAVCKEMRADPILSQVPIIFLTARSKDEDRITGFLAGGDDYLGKPFNLDELILRIRAVLRRTQLAVTAGRSAYEPSGSNQAVPASNARDVKIKGYCLNVRTFEVTTPKGVKILLTPVQYDLLFHFMTHPGEIFSPSRLLDEIWDYPSDAGSPDLVRVHIKNLRMRVEDDPSSPTFIETIPGYGYTIRTN